MLEYLTRTRTTDVHSEVMHHDAWPLVGIFDSAGLRCCELLGVHVMKQEPICVLELVYDAKFGISCGFRTI